MTDTDGGEDEIEPHKPTIDEIGETLMSWSHGLDEDGNIGSMTLGGKYGFLQLHAQEGAEETVKLKKAMYQAFEQALSDYMWLDDESVEEQYGEVTPETVLKFMDEHMDKRSFGENFLVWLAEELDVEYEPWANPGF